MEIEHSVFNTILGKMRLSTMEGNVVRCEFTQLLMQEHIQTIHQKYVEDMCKYFKGELKNFNWPLAPVGTSFQQMVWQALQEIPYGEVTTYGALANKLGSNANPRNVGQANGQNPIAIVIPCHRVVGADMKLTGYAGGIERKKKLLELEGAIKQQTLF